MDNNPFLPENSSENFIEEIQNNLTQVKADLKELAATTEQCQSELSRLTQKKAIVTAQLNQVNANGESAPRESIKEVYNAAMDAQQRLLVMRSQMDKLQEQQIGLEKYLKLLEKIMDHISGGKLQEESKNGGRNELSTLEMLINAQEAERQKLSRKMHDGPAQALSNFIVQTEIVSRMFDIDPSKTHEEVEKLKNSAMGTFQKVRSFVDELRPMALDDLGLVPATKRYLRNVNEQTGIEITSSITGTEQKIDPFIEIFIFRSIQELVSNSIKHNLENASKVKIEVNLSLDPSIIKVSQKDNGKGFDTSKLKEAGGLGLKLLQERIAMLDGIIKISSTPDRGTEVNFQIPIKDLTTNN